MRGGASVADKIKEGNIVVGQKTHAKVTKNKVGPPHRTAEYSLYFGKGIDTAGSMLEVGVDLGVIKKSGNTYTVVESGDVLGGSNAAAKAGLRANPELATLVEKSIYDVLQNGTRVITNLGGSDSVPSAETEYVETEGPRAESTDTE